MHGVTGVWPTFSKSEMHAQGFEVQSNSLGVRGATGPTDSRVRGTKKTPTSMPYAASVIGLLFHQLWVARSAMNN